MPLLHLKPCTTEQAGSIFSQLEASGCTVLDDDSSIRKVATMLKSCAASRWPR